ncbi:MAG: hypothetical protein QM750_23225 [Rubrivivax sp.]
MASDADNVSADALSSAIGSLFDLRQAGVDWATVAHAVLAFREEQRQRRLDRHDEWVAGLADQMPETQAMRRQAEVGGDVTVLALELQVALLSGLRRMGQDWRSLMRQCAPSLKRAADAYQAETDPGPTETEALINEVDMFGQAIGEFCRDQGARLEQEMARLRRRILIRHDVV